MRNPFPRPLSKLESKEKLYNHLMKVTNEFYPLNEDILPDSLIDKYNLFKDEVRNLLTKTSIEISKLKNEKSKENN